MPTVIVGQGVNAILLLAFTILLARWLGPELKGVHGVLWAGAQIGSVVLGFGYSGAIPYVIQGDPKRARNVCLTQARLLVLSLMAILGLWLGNRTLLLWPGVVGSEVPTALLLVGFVAQTFAASLALSLGDALVSVGASLAGTLLAWLFVGAMMVTGVDPTAESAIACQAIGQIVGATWAVSHILAKVVSEKYADAKDHLATARSLSSVRSASFLGLASNAAGTVLYRGDIFLVQHAVNNAAAGVYSVASFLVDIGSKVPQWTAQALTSVVARDYQAGIDRTLSLAIAAVLSTLVLIVGVLVARPWLESLLIRLTGDGFVGVFPMMIALAPRVILQGAATILAGNLAAHGYSRYHVGGTSLGAMIMAGTALAVLPQSGVGGAILASTLGVGVAAIVLLIGFARLNHIPIADLPGRSSAAFRNSIAGLLRRARSD